MPKIPYTLSAILLTLACSFAQGTGRGLTAFQAIELASKSVSPLSSANVIAVHGERSSVALNPTVWYVWFYVPGAMQNGQRVRVAGGVVNEVREGLTELGRARVMPYEAEEVMLKSKLLVDSSEALARLRRLPELATADISAVSFDVRKPATRLSPVWTVRIWGRSGPSQEERLLGTGEVSAETGEVIRYRRAPRWFR